MAKTSRILKKNILKISILIVVLFFCGKISAVPYLNFSGAADMKLPNLLIKQEKLSLAGGVLFNYDQAGDSELSLTSFGVNGAIHYQVNDMNSISLGVQSMISQRAFSIAGLRFNEQFDGDIYNPSLNNGENFTNENKAHLLLMV